MLRKNHSIMFLCLILFIGLATPLSSVHAETEAVKVGTDQLNIRKGPGLSYPIVAKAKKGEQYPLLSEKNEWMEIQLGNGVRGWVANWLVTKVNANQSTNHSADTLGKNKTAIISSDGLRIRKGPGTSYAVIGTANKGDKFTVLSQNGDWVNLQTPFGSGWVSNDFVQLQTTNASNSSGKSQGIISVNSLNVRSSPSLNSSIIGKLQLGDNVSILSQTSEWTEISFAGTNAWISSQYIQHSNSQSSQVAETKDNKTINTGKTGRVTATSLIVRESASLNGRPISSVQKDETLQIIEETNNWSKIEYAKGAYGWVASWYLDKSESNPPVSNGQKVKDSTLTISHNGSNIRKSPSTQSDVVYIANQGDIFDIISIQNDWYEIRLADGNSGYIAGWIVSVNGSAPTIEKPGSVTGLKNKMIVIDPGHGGRDNGTTGARGTLEKNLTLQTAYSLYEKLKATGANVILTRSNDTYIPLSSRVYTSHYHNADAFVSIHFDSSTDRSVNGLTTYYYHDYQKNLAASVHSSVTVKSNIKDRGYRFGDYYVLRENKRNAILLELGYLSNPTEEILISSGQYQDTVTTGIYQGLAKYFQYN
ncbi:SH3 domain-containing protein [Bacillus sp. S/N-304-OC-R1]|uniref:SH3 domain-containing protein n=1 Tax=Bacillus sp. S/N-304-OC-R1 TaxID=2758034 RepID=UPI001C8EB4A3|nr:SH3 domain-containing protein [Bacillus sp. S/N-304-OC-R1]MBY0123913.1 SH3 domain-containing protein [Bacillus sp. S/N-304-OC-R1]